MTNYYFLPTDIHSPTFPSARASASLTEDFIGRWRDADSTRVVYACTSGKVLPRQCSWVGWRTRPWIVLLSALTLEKSTQEESLESFDNSVEQWLRESHAKGIQLPENVRLKMTKEISGPTPAESSKRQAPLSLFFLENVSGLLIPNRKDGLEAGIRRIINDLAEDGWVGQWGTLRASDVGANHQRERVFLVAYRRHDCWSAEHRQQLSQRHAGIGESGVGISAQAGQLAIEPGGGFGKLRESSPSNGFTHRRREKLADDGLQPLDVQQRVPRSREFAGSNGELAHGECPDARSGASGASGIEGSPAGLGRSRSADFSNGIPRKPRQRLEHPGSDFGLGGQSVAQRGSDRGEIIDGTGNGFSGAVGNADEPGLQRREFLSECGGKRIIGQTGHSIPIFAPARNDFEEWIRLLTIDPSLMPAIRRKERGGIPSDPEETQSLLRGNFDGMEKKLDESANLTETYFHADQLRCTGNGVVPWQAAAAYYQLFNRLFPPAPAKALIKSRQRL